MTLKTSTDVCPSLCNLLEKEIVKHLEKNANNYFIETSKKYYIKLDY